MLLFLLVNESAYAGEVQRALQIPLTPLQSILRKFEKAQLLSCMVQGKRKLYRFEPSYPLLEELKALLKKGFIHLSPEEKRRFFSQKEGWKASAKDQHAAQKRTALCLQAFWNRLRRVQSVGILAQGKGTGQGFGEVSVEEEGACLLFTERGHWVEPQELEFRNTLRWTFDYEAGLVALEHLRYGPNRPVFLFHLGPVGPKALQSVDSHLCCDDCYFGRVEFTGHAVRFLWRILGPQKNEALLYTYQ